ncbi:hypothetical protein GCM10012275_07980 [Longimycelium tulufanense]|uniref:Scaffolding protein n=1 Tax=Longimycelium tulufanense TaxID=907463 RepID=A0A8J3CAW6_9PSEU|nr:hypothetical protein [Longimycelium tulufanense]GGM39495.1 hypothetical protein GCM10012275_07980 [Longimycelium tulufanense]
MTDTTEQPTPAEKAAPEATPEPTGVDALPEWAQRELRQARQEAANYRTKLRQVEPLAQRAKELEDTGTSEVARLAEQLEASRSELLELKTELTRERVLREYRLSEDLAGFLAGDEDTMRSAAERLSKLVTTQNSTTLRSAPVARLQSGGSAPNTDDDIDPDALAAKVFTRGTVL